MFLVDICYNEVTSIINKIIYSLVGPNFVTLSSLRECCLLGQEVRKEMRALVA